MRTPEEIVVQLRLAGLLEAEYGRPLRVHATEQVPDHAVLARGIQGLQHNQQRLLVIRVEQVLQRVHTLDMSAYLRFGVLVRLVRAGE